MTREEYLDLLKYYLKDLPASIVKDIIYDYDEHFTMGLEDHKTEEEISMELGSPKEIARQFLELEGGSRTKERPKISPARLLLIILASIILLPIVLVGLGVLVGLVTSAIGLIAGLIGLAFGIFLFGLVVLSSFIPGVLQMDFLSLPGIIFLLHPITRIFIGLASISSGLFVAFAGFNFFKWVGKNIRNLFLTFKWKLEKRRSRNEK